jgi:hypothetical protein
VRITGVRATLSGLAHRELGRRRIDTYEGQRLTVQFTSTGANFGQAFLPYENRGVWWSALRKMGWFKRDQHTRRRRCA